jgi:hypothetical protein
MTRRHPPFAPLSLAEREQDFQKAHEIAMAPAARPPRPTFLGRVRAVFGRSGAAPLAADVYRQEIAWRPLLSAEDEAMGEVEPLSLRKPKRPRATFLSRRLR